MGKRGPAPGSPPAVPADKSWHPRFLLELRKTGHVIRAVRAAGISHKLARDHYHRYPDFADKWDEAMTEAIEEEVAELEEAIRARAKQKDTLAAIFRLKALKPHVYQDRLQIEHLQVQIIADVRRLAEERGLPVEDVIAEARKLLGTKKQ